MPPMQLRSAVLPAPFGPISAVISPRDASSVTLRKTSSPPKRSVRLATSRIRSIRLVPPSDATILLDVAIAAFLALCFSEVKFFHVAVGKQLFARAVKYDAAVFQDVAVVSDRKHAGHVLIDDQHGQSKLAIEPRKHGK